MNANQKALLALIERYVKRQQFAVEAMSELRPDLVMYTRTRHMTPEIYAMMNSYQDFPGIGYWGQDMQWKYRIHGMGCRLIHVETQEPLDWDAPHPKVFDSWFFMNWLQWLLKDDQQDEAVRILKITPMDSREKLKKFTIEIIHQLAELGLISHPESERNENKYSLVAENSSV